MRVSDADMGSFVRAVNDANATDDPVDTVQLLEASDADVGSVPATDLRGARQAIGARVEGGPGSFSEMMLLVLFGLGSAKLAGSAPVDRRKLLKNVLLLVGGLMAAACSNQASPCTPLACDPSDGKLLRDGGSRRIADAAVSSSGQAADGGTAGHDGGAGHHRVDCPPTGFVCEEDYVVGGGYG
jgi:hypothetical protein